MEIAIPILLTWGILSIFWIWMLYQENRCLLDLKNHYKKLWEKSERWHNGSAKSIVREDHD